MSMLTKKGTITMPTTTQSVPVTGVGFQPKAIIFWCTVQTAAGNVPIANLSVGVAASSTQRKAIAIGSDDAQTAANTARYLHTTRCIIPRMSAGGTIQMECDLTSMDADGFTLALTVTSGAAVIVHYLALGGTDITNVFVGHSQPSAGTGNKSITGVGFTPDFVLIMTHQSSTVDTASTTASLGMGAFTATKSAVSAIRDQQIIPSNSGNYQVSGKTTAAITTASDTVDNESTLVSMDADGFTLNFSSRAVQSQFLYLCMKGGKYSVDLETQKTSTGTKAKTGVGFTPKGLFFVGGNGAASAVLDTARGKMTVGGSDGTNEGSCSIHGTDALSTTDANSWMSTTKAIQHVTNPTTVNAEADVSTFDADGYTLNWTTADGTAREFITVAFGDSLTLDDVLPDADVTTTGWTTTPLFSKVNDSSDATVIQATAS